jgi:tetratricopeptide (TPR) repeat protein
MARKAGRSPTAGAAKRQALEFFQLAVARSAADGDGAAALFERAFALDPDLGYAVYDAGVLYERSGDLPRARDAYARALKVNPDFEPASENLTRLRLRAGQAAEAESDLRARIAQYPSSLALRNQLVEVLLATDRLDGAEQESRKILRTDEHNIPAMVNLATAYYMRKRYELSRMVLDNARQVAPSEPSIWSKLAFTELALGNRPQALEDFKKAAELRRDYPEAQINYGAMLVESEDYANAVKHLEVAVRYAPSSPQAHLNLGNAYRGAKEFDKAQSEYERALVLDPKLVDAQYDLGVLYLDGEKPGLPAAERLEKAIAYFEKYAAAGGNDSRLAQYRKDAASQLDKERKRMAREEKERLRKAAAAPKAPAAAPVPPAAAASQAETQEKEAKDR